MTTDVFSFRIKACGTTLSSELSLNTGRTVEDVIDGLRQTLTIRLMQKVVRNTFAATITYFSNNGGRMHYDDCLCKGYPIASGVIEGARRPVLGNRLDCTGTPVRLTEPWPCSLPGPRT